MKSMTIIAFGLLVLVAVAVANPFEAEDDEAAEHLFTDDELSESPSPRKRPKRKMSKSVAYNETERPKRKRPNRDGPPRKRIIVKKPVNCPECDKVLCDSSSLKLHMVSF